MYKHFLITRFNLSRGLESRWQTTKNGDPLLTEEWLVDRFRLFETYCFPSVKNQAGADFTWLVFFDTNTPDRFRSKVQQMAEDFPAFTPVFIDGGKEFDSAMKRVIGENVTPADQFVITTRMDNDDMLHRDFMATLQRLFKPVHEHVINLSLGYQLIIEKAETEIFEFTWPSNPFISLIEKADEIRTVYAEKHNKWEQFAKSITNYAGSRLWMVLIHQNNVFNARKAYLKAVYKFDPGKFGLVEDAFKLKPFLHVWSHNLWFHIVMRRWAKLTDKLAGSPKRKANAQA